jgi:hypothetical protein
MQQDDSVTLEQRLTTLEVKLIDLEFAIALVTVVPDEGLPDCPLLELSSNGGDREPGTDAGLGARG